MSLPEVIPVDWQCSRRISESNKYMLDNQIECDATFIVSEESGSQQRMRAHKFVLISRSPVFFAMLSGPLAETGHEIRITDISPEIFSQLLRYLYEEDVELTTDNVFYVLYTAKKYLVTSLSKRCVEYLSSTLSTQNVCTFLENSFLLEDDNNLLVRCMDLVKQHSNSVFHSETFHEMSRETLCRVLRAETLTIHEIEVFRACVQWATRQCSEEGLEQTGKNHRLVMGDSIKYIHFPTLSVNEFTKIVVPTQILSTDEENLIFRYLLNNGKAGNDDHVFPFPTLNRECVECKSTLTYEGFIRHMTSYTSSFQGMPQRSRWSLLIYTDQSIKLKEISFLGKFKGSVSISQNGARKLELSCNVHVKELKLEDDSVSLDAGIFSIATESQFSYQGDYYSKSINNPVPGVLCDQDKVSIIAKESSALCFIAHITFIPTDEMHFVDNYFTDE